MAWDLLEFMTLCARHGRGIPPQVHVWADLGILLGTAAGTAIVVVQIVDSVINQSELYLLIGRIIGASFLVALMSVYFFLRNAADQPLSVSAC